MRCVIVTGVSRGLGAALARVLLDRDAVVLGVGRSSAAGLEGERYRFAACDLADVAGIDAALAPAFGALSGLSPRSVCLVNNAATVEPVGLVAMHDGAAIDRSLAVNLAAPVALSALFLRAFADTAVERRIVNVSSGAARSAIAGESLYCAAKAGLEMLTKVLAGGEKVKRKKLGGSKAAAEKLACRLSRHFLEAGDAERAARYLAALGDQVLGGLRFKSRTGKDPFEVLSNQILSPELSTNRIEAELPTGSGFYTLQPGLTVLYPTDPAVFFGGLNYQYNFSRSGVTMNTTQGPVDLGTVDPGDVIGYNFGMGLALNEKSSFSLGYDGASVGKTTISSQANNLSTRVQLGTLLLGYSQRMSPATSVGLTVGVGVTRDTPDVTLGLRVPMSF